MCPRRSMGRHPCSPPWQGRHCEARLQAKNFIARTESEEALELTTELRRTFISHLDARCGRRLLVSQHQHARLMKHRVRRRDQCQVAQVDRQAGISRLQAQTGLTELTVLVEQAQ